MPAYQAGSPRMAAPIWKRKRPKSLGKPVPLTPKQKAAAKAMAQAAGRPYPNLVDNIAASRLKNPIMPTIYTVKSEHLIADAERIEHDANESLNAWILLGQSEKYSEAMKTADVLRRAAASKNMTTRREILRNAGFTVKTPKQVTSPPEGEPRKENPTMKKPTPAQLAARARFAEMARSGAFKKKAKAAKAKKAAPKKTSATYSVVSRDGTIEAKGLSLAEARKFIADKAKRTKRFAGFWSAVKTNPAKKTVSQKISQLTREGYPQKQAVAIALSEERAGKVKRNPRASNPAKRSGWRITVLDLNNEPISSTFDTEEAGALLYAKGKADANQAGEITRVTPKSEKLAFWFDGTGIHRAGTYGDQPFYRTRRAQLKSNPATGEKRSRTKLNPVKYRDMAQNLRTDSKVAYAVHFPDRPSYHAIAYYSKKADAMEVAQETSDRIGKPLAVSRVQIYFGQE